MGWLTRLDSAIQQQLTAIELAGRKALRTAGPLRATSHSPVPEAMLAADKPALFYAIRRLAEPHRGVLAELQTLLITEGLRSVDTAWRGDQQTPGAYELAETVAHSLATLTLPGTAGVWLRHQQLAHADGRVVAFTQDYDVMQSGETLLIDDQPLLSDRCLLQLVRSAAAAHWQSENLAGSELQWASWQGRDGDTIAFEGTLWSVDEPALFQIETALETLLAGRTLHHLSTASDRSWQDVALVSWQRTGARIAQPVLGLVGQPIRIEFEQYRQ